MWNGTLDVYFNEDGTLDHALICGDDITNITATDKPNQSRWEIPQGLPPERLEKALIHLESLITSYYAGYTFPHNGSNYSITQISGNSWDSTALVCNVQIERVDTRVSGWTARVVG